jgi:hypothetical protein
MATLDGSLERASQRASQRPCSELQPAALGLLVRFASSSPETHLRETEKGLKG